MWPIDYVTRLLSNIWNGKDYSEDEDENLTATQIAEKYLCGRIDHTERKEHVGKVTSISDTSGRVDDKYFFDYPVPKLRVRRGDTVEVLLCRKNPSCTWKVESVQRILQDNWAIDEPEMPNAVSEIDHAGRNTGFNMVAKVAKVDRETVTLESNRNLTQPTLTVKLKNVKCENSLYQGDWLEVETVVQYDDFDQEVNPRDIVSLKPLLRTTKSGVITYLNASGKSGEVESDVKFYGDALAPGYVPQRGHRVMVDAVESDQGRCRWRAILVNQLVKSSKQNSTCPTQSETVDTQLFEKNGKILLDSEISFPSIEIGKTAIRVLTTSNKDTVPHKFLKARLSGGSASEGQFSIQPTCEKFLTVGGSEKYDTSADIVVYPRERLQFEIHCNGKFSGKDSDVVVLEFDICTVGTKLTVYVSDPGSARQNGNIGVRAPVRHYKHRSRFNNRCSVVVGDKFVKSPFFEPTRLAKYPLPEQIDKLVRDRSESILVNLPILGMQLTSGTYVEKFHCLLHVEEVAILIDISKYDMDGVCLERIGEYLQFRVPGLPENRPNLIVGDSINLQKQFDDYDQQVYEGCIHDISFDRVKLKFHTSFHTTYDGECCNIEFVPSRGSLRRCHCAIDEAIQRLGWDVLFPCERDPKDPQFEFIETEDSDDEEIVAASPHDQPQGILPLTINKTTGGSRSKSSWRSEFIIKKKPAEKRESEIKKLRWVNKQLNERQKSAVRRILRGEQRPAPYIIYGPPGTGKTVTVVEAALQVFLLCDDTRILISTPSNSSGDLITQRLVQSGKVRQGDMVRLNGFLRNVESIPEEIKRYCCTADTENMKECIRYRIVVSTCVTAGTFYRLGLKKGHFTHVFVDEAGCTTEPECLIPMSLLFKDQGQIVLAGDPKQLGPVLHSNFAKQYGLEMSLLERLSCLSVYSRDEEKFADVGCYNPSYVTKLINNYRSHATLMEFSSNYFYDGELIASADQEECSKLSTLAFLPNPGTPLMFLGVLGEAKQDDNSPSFYNTAEAFHVVMRCKDLYSYGVSPKNIGIITPYRKQVQEIRLMLRRFFTDIDPPKVGSVEEFQGQEYDVIIISTVRSSASGNANCSSIGFLADKKRLNVAITRSIALTIVIGNPKDLILDPHWAAFIKWTVLKKAYKGCNTENTLTSQVTESGMS